MNWSFWLAILLAKSIVFLAVVVVHGLANRGKRIGISGLYGIFVTQSNDFALGLPIVKALFDTSHPEYPAYLFLLVPIQLAILNPIGLILMEISKPQIKSAEKTNNDMNKENEGTEIAGTKIKEETSKSLDATQEEIPRWRTIYNILSGLFFNPIIIMTIAGLIFGTFVFKGNVPEVIDKFVGTLGNSFSALALFSLGLAMVGTLENFKNRSKLIIPAMLVTIKIIILPVVAYGTTILLDAGGNPHETHELAGFAFLFGTLPTAPTPYLFAKRYDIAPDMVAGAMVVCTIVSAPIIYGSGIIYWPVL